MSEAKPDTPFPWHLGVFDAHCHPTDTVASIENIIDMKTRALTIMATRGQDQSIVADFADRLGITSHSIPELKSTESAKKKPGYIVPCFGWHPWFSHQIYDDTLQTQGTSNVIPDKIQHYKAVIAPKPNDGEDDAFILSLPDPRPLSTLIQETRAFLERYPYALVGEIGIDRAFRIPGLEMTNAEYERDPALTPGGREGRRLSPYRVDIEHQKKILTAQLNLAGGMQRGVSVHGVAAHGIVLETLQQTWRGYEKPVLSKRERKKQASDNEVHGDDDFMGDEEPNSSSPMPFPPKICLHSYSGPPDTVRQYLHPSIPIDIYFSFSCLVNFSSTSKKAVDVIKAVPDDRILAESDLHAAGEKMDDLLEEIVRTVCEIKGWSLEDGVRQLRANWMRFIFGSE
ncbi:Cut9-interacting protein scn1 [Lecanora helva]